MEHKALRVIISGGGTGGHIFPAVSIANKLKELNPETEILFVGAEGKMEMEKVPAAGYRIVGLPIVGLQRQLNLKNILNDLSVPFKVVASVFKARRIIKEFKPQIAIGVGGYASAPLLWAATGMGIPSLIQEQNGFAGLTNKKLGGRVQKICVAYEGMERFFPADRILFTGNPLRGDFGKAAPRAEAAAHFGLKPDIPTILIVGGSLGTRTLNEAMKRHADALGTRNEVQVIWQTGKYYEKEMEAFMAQRHYPNIWRGAFIDRMDYAYAAADVVVSRSGACSVSELALAGKAVIFVPSPNVAEDHQTKNARALADRGAALLIPDAEAVEKALPAALVLAGDLPRREELERNIRTMATPDAAQQVASEIIKLARRP